MKLGIKGKLIFSFIIVIILPPLLMLVLLLNTSYKHLKNPNMKEFQEIENIQYEILEKIQHDLSIVNDYDKFHHYTEPLLGKYDVRLQVLDISNNILFDSKRDITYDNDKLVYNYLAEKNIIVDDKIVAKVFFYSNKNYKSTVQKFKFDTIGDFVIGLMALILLIILSTFFISRSILKPLKELNRATENIANGNLDFEIKYKKSDELGKFCNAFDAMRIKLKASLEKQVQYENSRKEMIASISHDLRTPLASIKGYVEGLQDGVAQDKEKVDFYLSVIKDKTENLDRLIEDLFQSSQLELGQFEMHIKKESSRDILEDIFRSIELDFENSNIKLFVHRPFPSIWINIDRYRISQIINNLIQNAKKYVGENGEIRIGATIKDNYLEIYVEDNGIGISEADMQHVFEPFYRSEKSRSRDYGGAGLGLSICKYIVETHKGKIWVDSIKNLGSKFYFNLPLLED